MLIAHLIVKLIDQEVAGNDHLARAVAAAGGGVLFGGWAVMKAEQAAPVCALVGLSPNLGLYGSSRTITVFPVTTTFSPQYIVMIPPIWR